MSEATITRTKAVLDHNGFTEMDERGEAACFDGERHSLRLRTEEYEGLGKPKHVLMTVVPSDTDEMPSTDPVVVALENEVKSLQAQLDEGPLTKDFFGPVIVSEFEIPKEWSDQFPKTHFQSYIHSAWMAGVKWQQDRMSEAYNAELPK